MMLLKIIICLIIGYFFGNISVSYIIGKTHNLDIRKYGSGNAGTTNVMRVLGVRDGIITFFGDALKTIAGILMVSYLLYPGDDMYMVLALVTGLGVVFGHNYPFWLEGKGGKGIAATGGVMLALDWRLALVAIVIFAFIVAVTKYVSLASLTITLLLPIWLIINYPGEIHIHLLGWLFVIFAFFRHKDNIKRLISGTENKVGKKAKKS